jgi:hypothetical protein
MNDENGQVVMEETPTERAFNRASAGYELFGKKLEPFTAMRQATASSMGLRFGLVDESDIYRVTIETLKDGRKDLQFYNQMFSDVIFVIWLCSIPQSKVLKALRKADEAKTEAFKWADDHGLTLTSEPYYIAAGVFFTIMQDIAVSTVVPDLEVKDDEDDEDSEDNPNE